MRLQLGSRLTTGGPGGSSPSFPFEHDIACSSYSFAATACGPQVLWIRALVRGRSSSWRRSQNGAVVFQSALGSSIRGVSQWGGGGG